MWRRRVRRSQPWWGCHLVLRVRIVVVVVVSVECHWKRLCSCSRLFALPVGVRVLVVALELFEILRDHSVEVLVDGFSKVVYWK